MLDAAESKKKAQIWTEMNKTFLVDKERKVCHRATTVQRPCKGTTLPSSLPTSFAPPLTPQDRRAAEELKAALAGGGDGKQAGPKRKKRSYSKFNQAGGAGGEGGATPGSAEEALHGVVGSFKKISKKINYDQLAVSEARSSRAAAVGL